MSSGLYQIRDKNLDTTLDLTRLKPYGDTMNDGKVQTSFTLPVKDDDKGAAAAVMLAQKMGLADPNVALRQKLDENFTFYVVYGSLTHSINYNEIVVQTVTDETMDMHENDEFLKERLGRKMVVIGASTGTDAHTVGIDAIMNRKGFAGHYGLERYDMIEAYNLGSQVPNEEFLRKAAEVNADVLLVSQTVTQKDVHIQNLTELIELAEAATSISSAAAAPASPTPWPRSWAMTPASARAPTPTTWPPSAPRSWSAAWASKTYSPLFPLFPKRTAAGTLQFRRLCLSNLFR